MASILLMDAGLMTRSKSEMGADEGAFTAAGAACCGATEDDDKGAESQLKEDADEECEEVCNVAATGGGAADIGVTSAAVNMRSSVSPLLPNTE